MTLQLYLAEFAIEDILSKINIESLPPLIEFSSSINGLKYNLNLFRWTNKPKLKCFAKSTSCVCCGTKAEKFILIQQKKEDPPALQLIGNFNDKPILFTVDHIVPLSMGGINNYSNYQTMCSSCNNLKSNLDISFDEINKLPRRDKLLPEFRRKVFWTHFQDTQVFTYLNKITPHTKIMYRKKHFQIDTMGTIPILVNMKIDKQCLATDGRWQYQEGEIFTDSKLTSLEGEL